MFFNLFMKIHYVDIGEYISTFVLQQYHDAPIMSKNTTTNVWKMKSDTAYDKL